VSGLMNDLLSKFFVDMWSRV